MSAKKSRSPLRPAIPVQLTVDQFNEFIYPHLPEGTKFGPKPKINAHKTFNYILKFLHLGCQWFTLPIDKDENGEPEIHYVNIFRKFQAWVHDGLFNRILTGSVLRLFKLGWLDTSILHGDGTNTTAKKGGDNIGYNGHKHMKGDKVVAICDRNCYVIAPFVSAPGNRNESPMLPFALDTLKSTCKDVGIDLVGSTMSLDGVYDSQNNRKKIFNIGMKPNIPENDRNRKKTKRGRKRHYCEKIFNERFYTIERIFGWEDKFKRLLLRFERISAHHYALKTLAYTMINLRNLCR